MSKTVEIKGTATPNSGAIRRNILSPKELTATPQPDVTTLYEILLNGANKYGNKEILGARHIVNVIEEEKEVTKKVPGGGEVKEIKKWKFFELSGYEWLTFSQVKDLAHQYGSGLRALGLKPTDKLTVYAETSRDWILTAFAASTQNITITTAYATLGEEGLVYSLQECEITHLFTNADLLPMIIKVSKQVPALSTIIYNGTAQQSHLDSLSHLKVVSLDQLKELGIQHPVDPTPPKSENLACIMYTSGSTGPPKGVMILHGNLIASVAGANNFLKPMVSDARDEVYLAYLPLAHILEMVVEVTMLYLGLAMGYGSVKTLTDSSVRNCKGDIRELRPMILCGVPQVWESIRKAVIGKIDAASPLVQSMFSGAFNLKWWLMCNGMGALAGPLDAIVFNKIKDQVGGRLKYALSGGAPMPKSTQQFMNVAATILVNGYGMTECSAVISIQDPYMITKLGILGGPVTSLEVKLVDVPDMNYRSTNLPRPQGELWVRGPSVMKGYYKQPQQTKEALTDDGWLMTGDIAEWNEDGTLQIIDRKKNLVKLANGEYIAIEKLESTYKVSPYVQNICVHAESEQTFAVALVFPIEKEVHKLVKELNLVPADSSTPVEQMDLQELCDLKPVREAVLKSLKDIAKSVGFKPAEVVGQLYLVGEEWTPQNGLLTAAMKLQRKSIVNKYKDEIKAMYKQ
ncbi:UNVERIFIED_CONTAM: long-chain fatty acid-CoA ligase [Siphonaria sp. JEL0065]|nr:long-chain fatty acid-CoA ligase [Siphonaria sp. JEL0065]